MNSRCTTEHTRPPKPGIVSSLRLAFLLVLMGSAGTGLAYGEDASAITPTDVYYLAKAIDDSIVEKHNLATTFDREKITLNAKPRNVYQRALALAEEYNVIHPEALDATELMARADVDASSIRPKNVYGVLELIKKHLESSGTFTEPNEQQQPKDPSDVYHMIRMVSSHLHELAGTKGVATTWRTPARVYQANVTQVLPKIIAIASENKISFERFRFPPRGVESIRPRHVFVIQQMVYRNLAAYYEKTAGYESLQFETISDLDAIDPGDVFDLTKLIVGELEFLQGGNQELDADSRAAYDQWKESRAITPGDVYLLVQYNFNLTNQIKATNESQ